MLTVWPNRTKLYDEGRCLYYGVPFNDEQVEALSNEPNQFKKEKMIREWRDEYLKSLNQSSEDLQKEADELEEIKNKILALDPQATFKSDNIETLKKRLEKLEKKSAGTDDQNTDSEDPAQGAE